jgi:2-keto-4-pentenoate hydratase/2-oxohepta-3-ene-1,7-dioic acid hydratase in catechol pathway
VRLVSYLGPDQRESFGVLLGDAVADGAALLAHRVGSIRELLSAGLLGELASRAATATPTASLAELSLLPVIPDPAKIICVGLNYRSHITETGRPIPEYPTLFPRYADSQMGHLAPARLPPVSTSLDYEGELAVVMGAPAHRVPAAQALALVAGYAAYNDFSVRDWQRHTSQFMPGKNFPGTGGFGPWLVTADEIPDVADCLLTTRVNGEIRQRAELSDLVFAVPELISYISAFTPLSPGDVIVTGTPGGVGLFRDPPAFLQPGDIVEVNISRIGTLVNTVTASPEP